MIKGCKEAEGKDLQTSDKIWRTREKGSWKEQESYIVSPPDHGEEDEKEVFIEMRQLHLLRSEGHIYIFMYIFWTSNRRRQHNAGIHTRII